MAHQHQFQECTDCFYTTKFPGLVLNQNGRCSFCDDGQLQSAKSRQTRSPIDELQQIAQTIRRQATGPYHCVIGVSGGLDSSYVLYIAKKVLHLNPLAVMYDNGFRHQHADENLKRLCLELEVDLRIERSAGRHDIEYVRQWYLAMKGLGRYWGVCKACHYILPVIASLVAQKEKIPAILKSYNVYEGTLHWPKGPRRKLFVARICAQTLKRSRVSDVPRRLRHAYAARHALRRFKEEFPKPETTTEIMSVDVSRYVRWDIDNMVRELQSVSSWRPLFNEMPMRFDCMLEDTLMNGTYHDAGGLSIHAILASNLIYDGTRTKDQLRDVVAQYNRELGHAHQTIEARLSSLFPA